MSKIVELSNGYEVPLAEPEWFADVIERYKLRCQRRGPGAGWIREATRSPRLAASALRGRAA
jgi:hypothetical protein